MEAVAAATSDDEEDLEVGRKDSGIEGSEDEFDGAFEEVEINVEEEDVAEIGNSIHADSSSISFIYKQIKCAL